MWQIVHSQASLIQKEHLMNVAFLEIFKRAQEVICSLLTSICWDSFIAGREKNIRKSIIKWMICFVICQK